MPSDQPYYDDYLPPKLVAKLDADAVPVPGVPGLRQNAQLAAAFPQIDTAEALRFVVGVYEDVADELRDVLALRVRDREFIDTYTAAAVARNRDTGAGYLSAEYDTVIGAVNPADGRDVMWPAVVSRITASGIRVCWDTGSHTFLTYNRYVWIYIDIHFYIHIYT